MRAAHTAQLRERRRLARATRPGQGCRRPARIGGGRLGCRGSARAGRLRRLWRRPRLAPGWLSLPGPSLTGPCGPLAQCDLRARLPEHRLHLPLDALRLLQHGLQLLQVGLQLPGQLLLGGVQGGQHVCGRLAVESGQPGRLLAGLWGSERPVAPRLGAASLRGWGLRVPGLVATRPRGARLHPRLRWGAALGVAGGRRTTAGLRAVRALRRAAGVAKVPD